MTTIVRNRLRFEQHFVQIPNAWLRDARLSFGARGLLAQLMTHDEGWNTSVAALVKNGPQGKSAINAMLKELEAAGYLQREQRREGGRFESSKYIITDPFEQEIREIPRDAPFTGFRSTEKPSAAKPSTANQALKNTNLKNTNLEEEQLEEDGGETRVGTSPAAADSDEERPTPYEDLHGKSLERPAAPRRADRCDFHQGTDYPPPCFGCKQARQQMMERDRQAFHARLAQDQAVQLEAHRLRIEQIDTCQLCDSDGYVNGWLCDHDPGRPERVASGAAMLRQALRGGQDG
jgi:hypothetical protein